MKVTHTHTHTHTHIYLYWYDRENVVRRKESEVATLNQSLYMLEGVSVQKATKSILEQKK